MGRKIGCGALATMSFASAAIFCKKLHELFDEDYNVFLTILIGAMYVFAIAADVVAGLFFYLAIFATGGEVETSSEEETEAS